MDTVKEAYEILIKVIDEAIIREEYNAEECIEKDNEDDAHKSFAKIETYKEYRSIISEHLNEINDAL